MPRTKTPPEKRRVKRREDKAGRQSDGEKEAFECRTRISQARHGNRIPKRFGARPRCDRPAKTVGAVVGHRHRSREQHTATGLSNDPGR